MKDIRVETYTDKSPLVRMRITHKPTGIMVRGSSKHKDVLREMLLKDLNERIGEREEPLAPQRCRCEDVEMGSYDNQIHVHPPAHMPKENGYCLDKCVAEEVMGLWMKGITTTGCCCGHNKVDGFIGVHPKDVQKMKDLGYEVQPNPIRPNNLESFYPKSVKRKSRIVHDIIEYDAVCRGCGESFHDYYIKDEGCEDPVPWCDKCILTMKD